jgi:RNA polymerase sigma-70 factor, ECF subfamily
MEPPGAVRETPVPGADVPEDGPGFEEFFERHYAPLARGLVLVVGDGGEAEDLAEEAFVRAWDQWERVRSMASPVGYVYRVAVNLHRNRVRRIARELRRRRRPEPVSDPAEAAEARDEVRRALAALPSGQREALVLVGWFGMSVEEAARTLGIAPSSLRSRLHRARHALRRRFGGIDG